MGLRKYMKDLIHILLFKTTSKNVDSFSEVFRLRIHEIYRHLSAHSKIDKMKTFYLLFSSVFCNRIDIFSAVNHDDLKKHFPMANCLVNFTEEVLMFLVPFFWKLFSRNFLILLSHSKKHI